MQRLEEEDYLRDLTFEPFCDKLAAYYADINMLHPFREGNGRAPQIFFEQLIIHAGYDIHWHPINRQDWLHANEAGAFGDPALRPCGANFCDYGVAWVSRLRRRLRLIPLSPAVNARC